jgi:pimeloyl-ACP methyl ester carboxylesterase
MPPPTSRTWRWSRRDSASPSIGWRRGLPKGTPLALVGHDFGAMHGLLLASRRHAFKAAVLIAATPRWGEWFLRFWKVGWRPVRVPGAGSRPSDPLTVAPQLRTKSLWQFSDRDYVHRPECRQSSWRRALRSGCRPSSGTRPIMHAQRGGSGPARALPPRPLGADLGLAGQRSRGLGPYPRPGRTPGTGTGCS